MIGHEAVGWTEQMFTCGGMEHEFPERCVKGWRKPVARARFQSVRPEDHSVALVMVPFQAGQLSFPAK